MLQESRHKRRKDSQTSTRIQRDSTGGLSSFRSIVKILPYHRPRCRRHKLIQMRVGESFSPPSHWNSEHRLRRPRDEKKRWLVARKIVRTATGAWYLLGTIPAGEKRAAIVDLDRRDRSFGQQTTGLKQVGREGKPIMVGRELAGLRALIMSKVAGRKVAFTNYH